MPVTSSLESPLSAAAAASPLPAAPDDTESSPVETEAEREAPAGGYGRHADIPVVEYLKGQIDEINLADRYSPEVLNTLGALVVSEFNIDENSRSDWKDKADKAMKFCLQEAEEKQYPWPKASAIIFPLITDAAIQFNARTYPAVIQNRNVVKGIVWGSDKGTPATTNGKPDGPPKMHPDGSPVWLSAPGDKRKRADRIGDHMSWQLLEEMPEWEAQTDTLLMQLPIMGGAARKTYRDPMEERNRSLLVSLKNLVWNYHAPSFEDAPRHTEIITLYPHQIEEYERAGVYLELLYGPGGGDELNPGETDVGDTEAPHTFLEQHRRYDLDGDGYPEPYIVTVHKRSSKVVRIVARYDADGIIVGKGPDVREENGVIGEGEQDEQSAEREEILKILPVDHYTLIPFLPNPDGGSYPVGFGHLLRPLNEGINTTLNQMFDAGHLQNAGGGFVSDQLSIASGPVNFQVGKYVRVGSKGMAIKDSVFPLPFPGPSAVLLQLLSVLLASGKETAGVKDILAGDAAIANAPPTTVLALIEQGLKVYTAIHKRVYRALKAEFNKLYRLNRLYLKDEQRRYKVGDEWREVQPDDYRMGGGVVPIADPTMITDMQKLGRAQILFPLKDDAMLNKREIYTRMFDAASLDRVEDLFAPPQNPQIAAMLAQMAIAEKQAELGRVRAAELKDNSQAYLNMAMAKSKVDDQQAAWVQAQLRIMELHIESVNTMVKAADVEAKSRGRVNTDEARAAARSNAQSSPAVLPPTSNGGGLPLTNGGAGAPMSAAPPAFDPTSIGARLAPDGNHYLPDPSRPGKFLMVTPNAG